MYDWLKPSFARRSITLGRVKASARKIVDGCSARIEAMHHSQNGKAFVCGLSTRKIVTPWSIQNRITSASACHNAFQSSVSKSIG